MEYNEVLERERLAYGYQGKPQAWQVGFDRGFKEAWQAQQLEMDLALFDLEGYIKLASEQIEDILELEAEVKGLRAELDKFTETKLYATNKEATLILKQIFICPDIKFTEEELTIIKTTLQGLYNSVGELYRKTP